MKLMYPAIARKLSDDLYEAWAPDLTGCHATGDSFDDAMNNLNHAALEWIEIELFDDDGVLPPVTDADDLSVPEDAHVRMLSLTLRFTDGWEE